MLPIVTLMLLGLGAFFTGPPAAAVRTCHALSSGLGRLRQGGESGPASQWTYAHRTALRIGAQRGGRGVRDRVELVDADARDLPFASASFDLVVSSLAISNIREAGGQAQALREAVRVLRPGGRLHMVDDGADRYAAVLRDLSL